MYNEVLVCKLANTESVPKLYVFAKAISKHMNGLTSRLVLASTLLSM